MNNIKYYDDNADAFYKSTVDVDMSTLYEPFLPELPAKSHILDAGCGSGRDSLYFKKNGYQVTAIDASESMAKRAGTLLQQEVQTMSFSEIDWTDAFEGIWCCASLLHVTRAELPDVLSRLSRALKTDGVLYASFKHGNEDRTIDGRSFTDMTEETIRQLISDADELSIREIWITEDKRPNRSEKWLNALIYKSV